VETLITSGRILVFMVGGLEVLVQREDSLRRVRNLFFPAISELMVTGYDLVVPASRPMSGFVLSYFHSSLRRRHRHAQQLLSLLDEEGLLKPQTLIPRYATYLQNRRWEKTRNMRYFLLDETEVSFEQAIRSGRRFVGEQLQYEWRFPLEDAVDLREMVKFLKDRASKYKLNRLGEVLIDIRGHWKENVDSDGKPQYVYRSWEVPLITLSSSRKPHDFKDFLNTAVFNVSLSTDPQVVIQSLVRSRGRDFKAFLMSQSLRYCVSKKYVLKNFIDYLDKPDL